MDVTSANQKPSILFTNLFLAARSGSELHILELAKAFSAKGWNVTCYTLVLAYPLQDQFAQAGIKVIRFGEERLLADHYSVLYAQHHIVSDYIWNCTPVTFDKVIVASLGPQSEHEKLPSFSQEADLQVFVSFETLEHNQLDNSKIPTFVFPNSVDKSWFECARYSSLPKTPKRIAVISNHVAQELLDLKRIVSASCHIDCYGYEGCSVEITPSLITSYDLIISIGRTVPLCFAARVPLYCYDVHGGPGYISPDTVDRDAFFNFSGRSNPYRRSAQDLLDDIISNYESATRHLDVLHSYAQENSDFSNNFERLYHTVATTNRASAHMKHRQCTELTKINCKNQCETFVESYSKTLGIAQLFFSSHGEPANESNSITFPYCYHTEIDASNLIQSRARNEVCIRFDPDIHPVICTTSAKPNISALNRERSTQEGDLFITSDPIYLGEIRRLQFYSSPLSDVELCLEYYRLKTAKEESEHLITELEGDLEKGGQIVRSCKDLTPIKVLKKIKSRVLGCN
ncbi:MULTISPECIES: glycosyltransferase family protein [Enorma]|uniref:glycosyltransferase family 4 protein n=1 Tax=Enorma TaxID=1472762 RepID=UPI0012B6C53E|nr:MULTISPECIES: glycosyltransferase family 4 protein [Enorma]